MRNDFIRSFVFNFTFLISYFPFFRSHNARAHLAWVVTGSVRQTARNRLKIGARREGTVSDDILETRRLPRTGGGDPASICLGARRGVRPFPESSSLFAEVQKNCTAIVTLTKKNPNRKNIYYFPKSKVQPVVFES